MGTLPARLEEVRTRIGRAAERAGRDPDAVELVAVSKTWPAAVLRELVEAAAGSVILGENKMQEAEEKIPQLDATSGSRWHFIGHLQRNKARKAVELFEAVHSVDSLRLAERLDRMAGELGRRPQVYVQVRVGGEASKGGFEARELGGLLGRILQCANLEVCGLMCIPPPVETPEEARASFRTLRELRDRLQDQEGRALPGLSMGMSDDFEVAIEEGATIVRVGSAIFGSRHAAPPHHPPGARS